MTGPLPCELYSDVLYPANWEQYADKIRIPSRRFHCITVPW